MSKERARRRAEREAVPVERERRQREVERAAAGRRRRARLLAPVSAVRALRPRRTDSLLVRQRRRQDAVLLGLLFAVHVALWLVTDSWTWRISALVLTVMAWPVLTTILFDRRTPS